MPGNLSRTFGREVVLFRPAYNHGNSAPYPARTAGANAKDVGVWHELRDCQSGASGDNTEISAMNWRLAPNGAEDPLTATPSTAAQPGSWHKNGALLLTCQ